MSRKNLLNDLGEDDGAAVIRRLAPAPSVKLFGAAMDEMRGKVERAREIEKALAESQRVVEIDPALIDPSPVRDRLPGDAEEDERLRASIAETGQQIPVLLRRSGDESRFITVFGHRRIEAVRALGRMARAIVVDMSTQDALVAQGVENAERKDLTFIERAVFAARLEREGLAQGRVAVALATSRPRVNEMVRVARAIPFDLIEAIGRAPRLGRTRWTDLAARLEAAGGDKRVAARWRAVLRGEGFAALDDESRLRRVLEALAETPSPRGAEPETVVTDRSGAPLGVVTTARSGAARVDLDKRLGARAGDGATFAQWLAVRLPDLKEAWEQGE